MRHPHFRRWGAVYLLLALFLASWAGQAIATAAELDDSEPFWPTFWSATFENWQSEWLQLLVQAVVLLGMKHILFKADAEDLEKIEADLDAIKAKLGIGQDSSNSG